MLTVFFSTLNGARTLPRVLDAYGRLEEPNGGWKLVAIDNGSTDETLQILESQAGALPLTVLVESKPGKNSALNTGVSRLDGDLAVFTDDDAIPSPGWLRNLRVGADSQPNYTVFGGPVLPNWDSQPADWIISSVPAGPAFATTDGDEGPVKAHRIFGANMAVRSHVFENGFRFDESIGPRGRNYAMGSETELLVRLGDAGYTAWFCKEAQVSHMIRSYQLEPAWLFGRARRFGRGQYRLTDEATSPGPRWAGVPRWMIRLILASCVRYLFERCRLDHDKAFAARWELNVILGRAIEARLRR